MEIPLVQKEIVQKTDTAAKPGKADSRKALAAYKNTATGSDAVAISSKAKLMQKLRAEYDKLETEVGDKVAQIKAQQGTASKEILSAEDLVKGILKGTLYQNL